MSINRNLFMVTPAVDCDITADVFAKAPSTLPRALNIHAN